METYERLAIGQADGLIFGRSPRPLTLRSGLTIGGGTVYPELNFTLPVMPIEDATMPEVRAQYEQMITDACKRADLPNLRIERREAGWPVNPAARSRFPFWRRAMRYVRATTA